MPRVVGSPLSLVGSGRRSIVAATLKTRSDGADVAVIPRSCRAATFRKGNDTFSKTLKQGYANPWLADQKWPGSWSFVAREKGQVFKQALRFLKGIAKDGLRMLYCCRPKAEQIFRQIWWILGDKSVVTCKLNNNNKNWGPNFYRS